MISPQYGLTNEHDMKLFINILTRLRTMSYVDMGQDPTVELQGPLKSKEYPLVCSDQLPGHQRLFEKGKLLRRDISPGNVFISDDIDQDSYVFVADLDYAKKLDGRTHLARKLKGVVRPEISVRF